MNRFLYRLMYILGRAGWDSGVTPPEVIAAFAEGDIPTGAALDLGCGTGTNTIFMARQGRRAIGLDYAPEAIARAKRKAGRAGLSGQVEFRVADVTRLAEMDLPPVAFALDMGCLHGLSAGGREKYAAALAGLLIPGGKYMLYTLDPRSEAGVGFGMTPEQVRALFEPVLTITREERGTFWEHGSTWFWMTRPGR